jgi:transposase
LASPIKKILKHPKAIVPARRIFQEKIAAYEAAGRPIVYLDESGFAQDAPRTHGYAPAGQRCHGTHDWHAPGRINAIGALIGKLLITVSLFAVNINADVFHAWAMQDLLPKLPSHAVVVMDNAAFHKRQDTREAIQNAGHTLEYLPAYSPDLNPIEHKWAQAKALRKQQSQSVEMLFKSCTF